MPAPIPSPSTTVASGFSASMKADYALGDLDGIEPAESYEYSSLPTLTYANDRLIVAKPCHIDREHLGQTGKSFSLILPAGCDNIRSDKLTGTSAGKFAPHSHSNEIRVFSIISYPLLNLGFVGAFNGTTINLESFPAMAELAKTLTEASRILGGVPKGQPDNLCFFI